MIEGALTIKLLSLAALLIKQCAAPAVFSHRTHCNNTESANKKKKKKHKNFLHTLQDWMKVQVSNGPCFIPHFLIFLPPAVRI